MNMKNLLFTLALVSAIGTIYGQEIDTVHNIETISVTKRRAANYIARGNVLKAEVTSAAGLAKMACCNLAESFENSATVSVGYSDAISGARQIKMLGLNGIYTQMLDESRPIMRALSSPYGLSYTPGAWLQSIQTSKGVSSVVAGHEAIAGQINIEPRKPTDLDRLFVNAYFDQDLRTELNLSSALQLSDRLSTVLLAHGSTDPKRIDHNHDGFMDMPLTAQMNFANRWLYAVPGGVQIRAGVRFVRESRKAGQMDYDFSHRNTDYWGSKIENKLFNGYLKVAVPTDERGSNLALVTDYTYYDQSSYYGLRTYSAGQNSILANIFYQWKITDNHTLIVGASTTMDYIKEQLDRSPLNRNDIIAGAFAEYTTNLGDKVTIIGGLRVDNANFYGTFLTPRAHLKWSLTDALTLRGSAGLGYRASQPISDNIWALATGREIIIDPLLQRMERAATFGGSLTQTFPLGRDENSSVSVDVFRSLLSNQVYADQESNPSQVQFYNVSGQTTTYQIDFTWQPIERFDVLATFRYNDSKINNSFEKPLIDRFKGLLNLQYATKFRRWVFDVTGQINGQSRLPQTTGVTQEYSSVFPLFFAQVTRKFKGVEVYLGCENIGDYKQQHPIISAENPFDTSFNSSVIYAPLMGRKIYAGIRLTIE